MKKILYSLIIILLIAGCSSVKEKDPKPIPQPLPTKPLCFIGDTGTAEKAQWDVAKALEKEDCSKIFILGDVIYPTGLWVKGSKALTDRFIEPYRTLMYEMSIPFYLVLGNHDHYGKQDIWLKEAEENEMIILPSYWYALDMGELCLLAYDTNFKYKDQIAWFNKRKGQLKDCKFSIAIAHHPYWSPGDHGDGSKSEKEFLESVAIGHVDLYLSGHDHLLADEGSKDGTRLMISGAGAKLRTVKKTPRLWALSKLGYVKLYKKKDNWRFEFKALVEDGGVSIVHSGDLKGLGIR